MFIYNIIVVNQFRYINNNFTKDKCSITMIWLLYWVSIKSACRLPLIIMDHLCILAIILPLSTVAKRTFYYNNSKITEFEMIDTKNSSTAYVVMYKLIA